MSSIVQDLRFGWRSLARSPGLTAAALATLALGLGTSSTMFTIADGVLLRPLPYRDPEQLVMIWETNLGRGRNRNVVSAGNFFDWRDETRDFEDMGAFTVYNFTLTGGAEPLRVPGGSGTEGLFAALGVAPYRGRLFVREDFEPGSESVAVVSYGFWQNRQGGREDVLGATIELNRRERTIVGVLPPDFRFSFQTADVWVPWIFDAADRADRKSHYLRVIGRLRPGVGIEDAQTELNGIAARLTRAYPEWMTGWGITVVPLHDEIVREARPAVILLLGAVGLLLLIACVNVANLLLARASTREREIAVRLSLGAGRLRLIRQLLTESLLLAIAGGVLGIGIAYGGVQTLLAVIPFDLPRMEEITFGSRVLVFAALLSFVTSLVFGLAPALRASGANLNESLKEGGGRFGGGAHRDRLRSGLVVAEVAVSIILLVGAGLLLRSFWRVLEVNPGFNPDRVLAISLWLPPSQYPENHDHVAFYRELVTRVRTLPGAISVAGVSDLPLDGIDSTRSFIVEGRPLPGPGEKIDLSYRTVIPGYFRVMGIPLLQGRAFTDRDDEDAPPVLVINQSMARRIWPDEDPVGQRISFGGPEGPWHEIVGVVADTRHDGLDEPARGAMFAPHAQKTWPWMSQMTLVVRTEADPTRLAVPIRSVIRSLDPSLPVLSSRTLEQQIASSVADRRFNAMLLGLFATVALVLAAVGLYGVMACVVNQRTREIGLRMALGAGVSDVSKLILMQGVRLIAMGVGLGLAAAVALSRVMEGLLFQVSATDGLTILVTVTVTVVVAVAANWIPARRAARVHPLVALRYE